MRNNLGFIEYYNVPRTCKECGGVMVYKGVGEYHCEDCDSIAYDDYGKVRLYIEVHRGATAAEVEGATGVQQRTIRRLLKEGRIEVAENSKEFLRCEMCGKTLRSGRYCPECETNIHRDIEAARREELKKNKNAHGFGKREKGESGQKRFVHDGNYK